MDLEFRQLLARLIQSENRSCPPQMIAFVHKCPYDLLRKSNDCFFQMEAWLYVKTEGTLEVSLNFIVPLEKQSIGLAKKFLANPIIWVPMT